LLQFDQMLFLSPAACATSVVRWRKPSARRWIWTPRRRFGRRPC